MNDTSIIVAIVAIFVTAFISYHIAIRQGGFPKPKLFTTIQWPSDGNLDYIRTWIVVIGIPNLDCSHFLLTLPYVFCNRSKSPLTNLFVHIRYPKERDPSNLGTAIISYKNGGNFGMERRQVNIGDDLLLDYSIPLLRPKEDMVNTDWIRFSRAEFINKAGKIDKEKLVINRIVYSTSAEKLKPRTHNLWLVAMPSNSIEDIQNRLKRILAKIGDLDKPTIMLTPVAFIIKLFKIKYSNKRIWIFQPKFKIVNKELACVEPKDFVFGCCPVDVNFYLKVMPKTPFKI